MLRRGLGRTEESDIPPTKVASLFPSVMSKSMPAASASVSRSGVLLVAIQACGKTVGPLVGQGAGDDFVLWKLFGWTEDAVYAKRDAASELCTCEASFLE